jgi:two-component system, cell cycle sensor histidine kinase and response regulator CckA
MWAFSADTHPVMSKRSIAAYVLAVVVAPALFVITQHAYGDVSPLLALPVLFATCLGGARPGIAGGVACVATLAEIAPITPLQIQRMVMLVVAVAVTCVILVRFRQAKTKAEEQSQAVRVTDERFAQLAGAIREVFWMTSVDKTTVLYVSPGYETVWGKSSEELYKNPTAWSESIHPGDRERIAMVFKSSSVEYAHEYRIVRADGTVRWIHDKATPVRDASGAIIAIAGIADDITERRELEEQLRQTQKLESLGLLAGGVAHDFNNILGVITANAEMLAEAMPEGHADRELVEEIDGAVFRAAALTRQLLAFSRKQVTDPVVLDINRAVADTRKMLRRLVGENVVVRTSLDPDLGRVRVDPSALVQVLMNLAVNARDAMNGGGTLTISTRSTVGNIVLAVSDTGCGMSPAIVQRAFEPFFTTKPIGKGTGLGLAVVHGIVQQAGGRIEIESEPEMGTTFRIYLPAVDAPADPILDRVAIAARGHEKIVLVEDDCYVRAAASRALRTRGYTVLEASDGRAALRLLRDHKSDVRLLITDIVMPGMNGRELAGLARNRMPALRILFMSGYADDDDLRQSVQRADAHFIEKPFRIHAFAAKVRQVLDETNEAEAEWRESSAHITQPLCERELSGQAI